MDSCRLYVSKAHHATEADFALALRQLQVARPASRLRGQELPRTILEVPLEGFRVPRKGFRYGGQLPGSRSFFFLEFRHDYVSEPFCSEPHGSTFSTFRYALGVLEPALTQKHHCMQHLPSSRLVGPFMRFFKPGGINFFKLLHWRSMIRVAVSCESPRGLRL